MKYLKTILGGVYVILVVLLLLNLRECGRNLSLNGRCAETQQTDTIVDGKKIIVKEKFQADVVMCIDCTSSMGEIIETIKNNALSFYPDLKNKCIFEGKDITSMRVRVIGYRDFDDESPFETSDFFDIPDEEENFKSFVSNLLPEGGGDTPERGYDALGIALKSDWNYEENVHHVIILWTDGSSHPLSDMSPGPKTFEDLTYLWNNNINQKGKRLILFAPIDNSWSFLVNEWDNTTQHDINGDMSDDIYSEILETLSESI